MESENEQLYYPEEKIDFLIKHLKLNVKDIANLFGVQSNYISKLRNQEHNTLKPLHLYAFTAAFNIPFDIFDKKVKDTDSIKNILTREKQMQEKSFFTQDEQVLKNLEGVWYAYFYPSNQFADVYRIKTTFHNDGSVSDENGNQGKVLIGKNQSLMVKEAKNSKNLISITFDNHQVAYEMFHFSLVSKRNHVNREMFNYGFFSRYEIELDRVKTILGEKKSVQLKMQCEFVERIAEHVEIIG